MMGACVAFGALKTAIIVGCVGGAIVTLIARGKFVWARDGVCLCRGGAAGFDPGAEGPRQRLLSADVRPVRGVGDRHRRLFRRPQHWRTETMAARKPEEDLGRRTRRLRGEPCGGGRLCGCGLGKAFHCCSSAPSCRWSPPWATFSNPRQAALRCQGFQSLDSRPWRSHGPSGRFVAAILMAWIIGFLRHGVHSAGSGLMVL